MRRLGEIVRLQVQRDSIKTGGKPYERYTPEPNLVSVSGLRLNADGVEGIDEHGNTIPDVHNATHPHTKFRGDNGLSIGFTGHYAAMRARFDDHLVDGIAGENMLVAYDEIVSLNEIASGIVIVGNDREIRIGPWDVAHPCAPFSRFCLKFPDDSRPDRRVTEALQFLENGSRGFTAVYGSDVSAVEIRLGDIVYAVGA